MEYEKNGIHAEGKTKIPWNIRGYPQMVRVESKNDVTAFDDPAFTKIMPDKAVLATTTTCRVFELLRDAGLPVSYVRQISAKEFLAKKTRMIPLEVVARRYAIAKGSFAKRFPHLAIGQDKSNPHRFHRLVVEFFLKTTKGQLKIGGQTVLSGLNPKKGEEDPLIVNPNEEFWKLVHSKKPAWDIDSDLKQTLLADRVISKPHLTEAVELTRKAFLVLEGAWKILGFRLADIKLEFGLEGEEKPGEMERLVISDVIDNDSWRLTDNDWCEHSKQCFRDGEPLEEVARKYRIVAQLASNFRIPKQALVIWTGSPNDVVIPTTEDINLSFPGVTVEKVVKSGHKQSRAAADEIDRLETHYPDGGVIILNVGRSNGAGPLLASRTTWPVISIPKDYEKFPEDVHSSVHLPSKTPNLTAWPFENALRAALNHLAQKNPAVYAERRYEIEKLDY